MSWGSPRVRRLWSPRGFRFVSSRLALAILPRVTPLLSAFQPLHCPGQPSSVRSYTTWMREPRLGWEMESAALVAVLLANPRSLLRPSPGMQRERRAEDLGTSFWGNLCHSDVRT